MTAAKVSTVTASPVLSKVIPLHQFGHEEQVKNTEQGASTTRQRKHPLPASNQVNVPATQMTFEEQFALVQQNFNALSQAEKETLGAKLQTASSTMFNHLMNLAKALKAAPQDTPTFDAWNHSILMAYTHFAEDQMNQNGLIMNGWQAQQQAQNSTLQSAADAESKNSNTTTQGAGVSVGVIIGIAIGAALLGFLTAGIGAVFVTGGAAAFTGGLAAFGAAATLATVGTFSAVGIGVAAGVVTGLAVGLGCGFGAQSNANLFNKNLLEGKDKSSLLSGLVDQNQSNEALIQQISQLNVFWNTISQKTNNNIQTGSQTDLTNVSSNDTQLGQQAAQAIQEMGQTMQTPLR